MPENESTQQAARLFQEAWRLLADLTELQRRLPEPRLPTRPGPLPPDWDDARSYAQCVDSLRGSLEFSLQNIVTSLGFRNEWHIQSALLPPERQQ
jgi:hypothetical protein